MNPKREKMVKITQYELEYLRWASSELRRMAAACPLPGSPKLNDCVDYAIRAMKVARYDAVYEPVDTVGGYINTAAIKVISKKD